MAAGEELSSEHSAASKELLILERDKFTASLGRIILNPPFLFSLRLIPIRVAENKRIEEIVGDFNTPRCA